MAFLPWVIKDLALALLVSVDALQRWDFMLNHYHGHNLYEVSRCELLLLILRQTGGKSWVLSQQIALEWL